MAQTYQMKHNPQGTIYSLLTVESDGQMTMTFHGTDREISHEVTENADGWLCYPGAMFPGLESGKWQAVAMQMRNEKLEMRNENEEMKNEVAAEPYRGQSTCNPPSATHTGDSPREPRVRRQRKARKTAAPVRRSIETSRQRDIKTQEPTTGNEWLRSAGYLAAATVALFVIYETGLLIPLGLIGLATSGLLK
jgi:hypothetical protein